MEMLKSKKSQLTCSYCSRIFKDPIQLPCGDSICRKHLSDRDILKANRIKCNRCTEEFGVKNNQFKSNEALKHSIVFKRRRKERQTEVGRVDSTILYT